MFAEWVSVALSRMCRRAIVLVYCVVCASAIAIGQQTTASVTGQVQDSTGAVVTGAKVSITNTDTNIETSTQSGETGDYLLTLLPPGNYKLTITHPGFKTYVQSG